MRPSILWKTYIYPSYHYYYHHYSAYWFSFSTVMNRSSNNQENRKKGIQKSIHYKSELWREFQQCSEIDLNGAFFLQKQIYISVLCFQPLYPIQKAEKTPVHFPQSLSLFCIWLTWPQEEVYQLRHGWRLQGIWLCGLEDMALQWKGRSCLWSLMSKHWTSRDLMPPSQFLEHWEKTRHDWYSNIMSYDFVVSLQGPVRLCGFHGFNVLFCYLNI